MLVAIYARHSTDKQCTSTQDQINRCRRYCAEHGYTVAEVFVDEAVSGSHVVNRPGIRDLMSAAVEGYFERVVAEDLSRISRDQADTANFYKKMVFLDIKLETVAEGPINELHIGLKSTMNALYLRDLADKTHRGMIASVLRGAVPGGRTYGYDVVRQLDSDGQPVKGLRKINETEAAVVRHIFRDYASGQSLKRICADLNAQAVPAPKGGSWIPTTLVGTASRQTGLLRNTLYRGIVTFNRMAYRKHPETGRRLSVVRPEAEWINVPIPELAIIDDKLFNTVQTDIEARSSMRHQRMLANQVRSEEEQAARDAVRQRRWRAQQAKDYSRSSFMFGGMLHCGLHGIKLKEVRSRLWTCSEPGCPNRNISFNTVMPLALDAAGRLDGMRIQAHFDGPEVAQEKAGHEAAAAAIKPQIDALRGEIRNILVALGQRPRTTEIKGYLDDQERQLRRLRLDLDKHQARLNALSQPIRTNGAIGTFQATLKRLALDPEDRRLHAVLRPMFQRFDLFGLWDTSAETWHRDCQVTFNYPQLLRLADK